MTPETRSLLPHLVVVAALADGAAVVALGLRSYPGVLAYAALFVATLPVLYAAAERAQPTPTAAPNPETDGR